MNDKDLDELMAVSLWLESARRACRDEPEPSKRHTVRYNWDTPMELLHGDKIHYVNCRDISASGIGVLCRPAMALDTNVRLRQRVSDPWIKCRVAHCTETVGKHKVGLAITLDI